MTARSMLAMFATSLTLLVFTMSVSRAQMPPAPPSAPAPALSLSGFYVNFFVGQISLDSTVRLAANERHAAARFVDQGGDGGFYGLRVGYGVATGMWYLGGELEGVIANNVRSRLFALGAEYRARLQDEGGAYFRAGYSPGGNWLMFGRFGLSAPRQLFEIEGTRSARRWALTPNIGVGAEFTTQSGIGLRLDWTHGLTTGTNAIETYRATAALVYRF